MVVGYVNNKMMEKDGKEIVYKEGMINFPLLPSLHVTINQNKKEDKKENEPDYFISLVRPKGYVGPKSRIGALWLKKVEKQDSPSYGKRYLSGNIETPIAPNGVLYISIFETDKPQDGEEPKKWGYEVIWNPPRPRSQEGGMPYIEETYIPENYAGNDDEHPF